MENSLTTQIARRRVQWADVFGGLRTHEDGISSPDGWTQVIVGLIFLSLALVNLHSSRTRLAVMEGTQPWRDRPVLGYFALTSSLIGPLQFEADLSSAQMEIIRRIAHLEVQELENFHQKSLIYVLDPELSLEEKRSAVLQMGYNRQVYAISRTSQQILALLLDEKAYARFVRWMERRWEIERVLHGAPRKAAGARTFEIYATRYDSKGAYYVALPDQCVKFTNGGNRICEKDGYVVGKRYDVYVSYKKGAAARVGESGPWNVDDTYWATYADPTPRRMFADLTLGMPEAQAAYFNGYNGGVDQYGRKVTAPYGIDLARQVSVDIGLEPGNNDWIQVGFLWTEDWGQSGTGGSQAPSQTTVQSPTQVPIVAAKAATPQSDGSLVYVVQPGQTLWEIAAIYDLSLQDLLELNNMSQDAMIRDGQKLIVKGPDPGLPLTQTANAIIPTETPRPTRTPTETIAATSTQVTETVQATPTPMEINQTEKPQRASLFDRVDPILAFIAALVVAGLLLLLVGGLMNRLSK
jgi:LysM repeat protein